MIPRWLRFPLEHAEHLQVSWNHFARPNWHKSMATTSDQGEKPHACRSAFISVTSFLKEIARSMLSAGKDSLPDMSTHCISRNVSWHLIRQLACFAGIGTVGTSAHYLALIILVQLAGVNPILASAVGFALGGLVNYFLNYRITFHSNRLHHEAMLRFFTVASLGAGLNALIMALTTMLFMLHYLLGQAIATVLVFTWNFFVNRSWTF